MTTDEQNTATDSEAIESSVNGDDAVDSTQPPYEVTSEHSAPGVEETSPTDHTGDTDHAGDVEPAETEAEPAKKSKKKKRRRRPTRIDRLVMEFQPDVVEIENRAVAGGARWTLYIVCALIVSVVVWACWAKVDRIVTAQGTLITTVPPVVIQPVTLSPIRSLYVKFGDVVHAGDKLAELDPTFAEAEFETGMFRGRSLQAQIDRLQTERSGGEYVIDLENADDAQLNEFAVYQDRKAEYDAKMVELETALKALETKIANNKDDQFDLRRELVVHEEIRENSRKAFEKGAISRTTQLAEEQQRLATERALNTKIRTVKELEDEIVNTRKKMETFKAEWHTRISAELLKASQEMAQNEQSLAKAQRMKDLIFLKVPDDLPSKRFMVMEVAERSVGSVLREGEALFKLMPLDVELVAEVEIPARDIARIQVGDEARLKLESFPYQKHGTIDGKVSTISESSFQKQPQQGGPPQPPTYRARVKLLNPDVLENVPDDVLMPGMVSSVEIKVGERRVIEYFLYPLLRNLDKSIREP